MKAYVMVVKHGNGEGESFLLVENVSDWDGAFEKAKAFLCAHPEWEGRIASGALITPEFRL